MRRWILLLLLKLVFFSKNVLTSRRIIEEAVNHLARSYFYVGIH